MDTRVGHTHNSVRSRAVCKKFVFSYAGLKVYEYISLKTLTWCTKQNRFIITMIGLQTKAMTHRIALPPDESVTTTCCVFYCTCRLDEVSIRNMNSGGMPAAR